MPIRLKLSSINKLSFTKILWYHRCYCGKTILIDNTMHSITAVIEDVPKNSHVRFEILLAGLPDRDWFEIPSESFWNPDVYTYLLVKEGFNPKEFTVAFQTIYNKYFKETGDRIEGRYTPILEPLASIHSHSTLDDFANPWFVELLAGLREGLAGTRFHVGVADAALTAHLRESPVSGYLAARVDGLVIAAEPSQPPPGADSLNRPMVTL